MNYIKNLKTAAIAFTAVVGFAACNKQYLEPIPQTVISDASAFETPDRILQQVFGVYSQLKNGNFLGGRTIVYNDVRGEDWVNVTGNVVTAVNVWNFTLISTDNQVENQWAVGYSTINRANVLIAGIDANPSVLPASLANRYKAEARFCRALANFYLVNAYGRRPFNADNGASLGIPLRLTASTSNAGASQPRATVAQVYNAILDDLNFAETNLPLSYMGSSDSNVVRAHRNSAIAFKTRVLMHMNRWADVITEANKLVPATAPFQTSSGVTHRLNPAFLTTFRTYTTPESIFSLPMTVLNAPGTQNGLGTYHNAEFALNPNGILADAGWGAADARRALVSGTVQPIRYTKYNSDNDNYVAIIRYAEVMLNLAEALARQATGVDARALALLNAIRQRSDASVTLAPTTRDELIAAILNERRIEFLGEGLRTQDIQRQNIAFPAKGSVGAVQPTAVAYVWPIPASELLYNTAMVPNQ
ncbi:MAG: RagB/SusD family nutrient uptake outer membrane protein [Bacteroidetes bacterium]|nr:MAG: RagB/SusD family nutrient uptake outer membrane protein [Bacteroidota bacterium]